MGVTDAVDDPAELADFLAASPERPTSPVPAIVPPRPAVNDAAITSLFRTPDLRSPDAASAHAIAAACPDLGALEDALRHFDGCALKKTATRLCFADGNPDTDLVLVGEAPGAEEDRQGLPFVGPSGRLLDLMLASIGLDRSRFWITNCLFWRPPGNRTPSPQELAVCQPFLERALELVAPKMVLFVGGTAARSLLGLSEGVTRLRGTLRPWQPAWAEQPIETLVTFHPAYLLRNPAHKRLVWRDLLKLRERLEQLGALAPEGGLH